MKVDAFSGELIRGDEVVYTPVPDGTARLVSELEPGEPIFVVRARDAFGLSTLNGYIAATDGLFSQEKMTSLYALREAFKNFGQLRFPD